VDVTHGFKQRFELADNVEVTGAAVCSTSA
jgi:hypothetical protein